MNVFETTLLCSRRLCLIQLEKYCINSNIVKLFNISQKHLTSPKLLNGSVNCKSVKVFDLTGE